MKTELNWTPFNAENGNTPRIAGDYLCVIQRISKGKLVTEPRILNYWIDKSIGGGGSFLTGGSDFMVLFWAPINMPI